MRENNEEIAWKVIGKIGKYNFFYNRRRKSVTRNNWKSESDGLIPITFFFSTSSIDSSQHTMGSKMFLIVLILFNVGLSMQQQLTGEQGMLNMSWGTIHITVVRGRMENMHAWSRSCWCKSRFHLASLYAGSFSKKRKTESNKWFDWFIIPVEKKKIIIKMNENHFFFLLNFQNCLRVLSCWFSKSPIRA